MLSKEFRVIRTGFMFFSYIEVFIVYYIILAKVLRVVELYLIWLKIVTYSFGRFKYYVILLKIHKQSKK